MNKEEQKVAIKSFGCIEIAMEECIIVIMGVGIPANIPPAVRGRVNSFLVENSRNDCPVRGQCESIFKMHFQIGRFFCQDCDMHSGVDKDLVDSVCKVMNKIITDHNLGNPKEDFVKVFPGESEIESFYYDLPEVEPIKEGGAIMGRGFPKFVLVYPDKEEKEITGKSTVEAREIAMNCVDGTKLFAVDTKLGTRKNVPFKKGVPIDLPNVRGNGLVDTSTPLATGRKEPGVVAPLVAEKKEPEVAAEPPSVKNPETSLMITGNTQVPAKVAIGVIDVIEKRETPFVFHADGVELPLKMIDDSQAILALLVLMHKTCPGQKIALTCAS